MIKQVFGRLGMKKLSAISGQLSVKKHQRIMTGLFGERALQKDE
jgi:hypothetical protein